MLRNHTYDILTLKGSSRISEDVGRGIIGNDDVEYLDLTSDDVDWWDTARGIKIPIVHLKKNPDN